MKFKSFPFKKVARKGGYIEFDAEGSFSTSDKTLIEALGKAKEVEEVKATTNKAKPKNEQ